MMTTKALPSCFAVHHFDDGRWEVLSPDGDYRRPPWVWLACITAGLGARLPHLELGVEPGRVGCRASPPFARFHA